MIEKPLSLNPVRRTQVTSPGYMEGSNDAHAAPCVHRLTAQVIYPTRRL
jgi:hypothetical protein